MECNCKMRGRGVLKSQHERTLLQCISCDGDYCKA